MQVALTDRLGAGGAVRLKYNNIVHSGEDRFRMQTVTSGTLRLRLNVLMRNFQRYHVQLA